MRYPQEDHADLGLIDDDNTEDMRRSVPDSSRRVLFDRLDPFGQ